MNPFPVAENWGDKNNKLFPHSSNQGSYIKENTGERGIERRSSNDWKRNSQLTVDTEYRMDFKNIGNNNARKADI